jgi:hypothetical protein
MAQLTFGDAEFAGKGKTTCKERFLAEMEQVVPWALIEIVRAIRSGREIGHHAATCSEVP